MRRLVLLLAISACGPMNALPLTVVPDAELAPPTIAAEPPAGPFNGSLMITFKTDRPATVFYSTDGHDPRTSSIGRQSGPAPLTVAVSATTTIKYFASDNGKDGELQTGTWVRAGGPAGTISGVVVVGEFTVGKKVGLTGPGMALDLGKPDMPKEIPFSYTDLKSGTFRLQAISDRNNDGQLIPFIDYSSDVTTITLDLTDPFKASAENVRIYLAASTTGLGTLKGIITLPRPPPLQNLQISTLDPGALTGGVSNPTMLLQQLQGGYRIFTDQMTTEYPYVITDLKPGQIMPVPSLIGFGSGGLSINLLANPLRPVTIRADETSEANFAFGPVTLGGTVTMASMGTTTPVSLGVVAAKVASLTDGIQAVLMPVLFTRNNTTGDLSATYTGNSFKADSTISLRVFSGTSALTDSLTWVVNPFATQPAHATVMVQSADQTFDIVVP